MKKYVFVAVFFLSFNSFAQIKTTKPLGEGCTNINDVHKAVKQMTGFKKIAILYCDSGAHNVSTMIATDTGIFSFSYSTSQYRKKSDLRKLDSRLFSDWKPVTDHNRSNFVTAISIMAQTEPDIINPVQFITSEVHSNIIVLFTVLEKRFIIMYGLNEANKDMVVVPFF